MKIIHQDHDFSVITLTNVIYISNVFMGSHYVHLNGAAYLLNFILYTKRPEAIRSPLGEVDSIGACR